MRRSLTLDYGGYSCRFVDSTWLHNLQRALHLESRYRGARSKLDFDRPSILRFTRQIESFDAIKPCPTNDWWFISNYVRHFKWRNCVTSMKILCGYFLSRGEPAVALSTGFVPWLLSPITSDTCHIENRHSINRSIGGIHFSLRMLFLRWKNGSWPGCGAKPLTGMSSIVCPAK